VSLVSGIKLNLVCTMIKIRSTFLNYLEKNKLRENKEMYATPVSSNNDLFLYAVI